MEVIETNITTSTYAGRSSGHNNGTGVTIIGPVLVQIDVVEYEHHTSSYYVSLDGRHQFGGFAHHLDANGHPHASFLTIGTRLDPRCEICGEGWEEGEEPVELLDAMPGEPEIAHVDCLIDRYGYSERPHHNN